MLFQADFNLSPHALICISLSDISAKRHVGLNATRINTPCGKKTNNVKADACEHAHHVFARFRDKL